MAHKIIVAGIGPGNPAYILPVALKAIREAKVLVGGRRALEEYAAPDQEVFPITGDLSAVFDFMRRKLPASEVVVMASGDPCFYSVLDSLREEFSSRIIEVVPGISSLQYACAKLGLSWSEAEFLSFHGREAAPSRYAYQNPPRMLGILTDGIHDSQAIARKLLAVGWPSATKFYICQRLSYPDETIVKSTLGEGAELKGAKNAVLVVRP